MHIHLIAIMLLTTAGFSGPASAQTLDGIRKTTILEDPSDRKNIRGNASIAIVWGKQIKRPDRYRDFNKALLNLSNAMNMWTEVYTTGYTRLALESTDISLFPFVIITTGEKFELTFPEKKNLAAYLENGGFLFCDNVLGTRHSSPVEHSFKSLMRELFGDRITIDIIPDTHEIFHAFFDFEEGPPKVTLKENVIINRTQLQGVWFEERLIAIYSNLGYIVKWSESAENILPLKMGVNMLIFALTQDGESAGNE